MSQLFAADGSPAGGSVGSSQVSQSKD